MRSVFAAALLTLLVIAGWVGLAGCQPNENVPFASEVDEPHYRRGSQLLRGGRTQEALDAFLKVVEKRGGDAPESHLECGILYLQHLKDPIAAIHHFRKYLELRPTSPQAGRTRELIDTATKEFARTLPATPFEGQVKMLDLMETVERLQKENFELKEQVAQLRGVPASSRPQPRGATPPAARGRDAVVGGDGVPTAYPIFGDDAPAVPVAAVEPAPVRAPADHRAPTAVAAGGRVHTVQKGDSLYAISRQYYGSGNRVADIVAANPGVLHSSSTPLKIGMQLRLP